MSQFSIETSTRYHGLDWLRAAAALAVIALHAGIAYTVQPFPGLAWPVHDRTPSVVVDAVTWWIDAWIMPVFFLLGGFLAAQLFERLGPLEFLKHRARRLLVPLAFGCFAILPLDLYVWLLGWVVDERIPIKKLRSLKLGDAGQELWGIGHLWFLEYLFVFCVAAIVVRWLHARAQWGRLRLPAQRGVVVMGAAFACSAIALWWEPRIVIGFRHAWHPLAANLLYYGPCFTVGWWLLDHHSEDDRAEPVALAGIAVSTMSFAAALPLIHGYAASGLDGFQRVAMTVLFAACGWTMALGVFRLSLIPCGAPPRGVRYVAQASLWLYLFHHPAVGLAQVALHGSELPAEVKYVLVMASAVALSLLTYEALVRRTWIGALLNGRRDAPSGSERAPENETSPMRSAA